MSLVQPKPFRITLSASEWPEEFSTGIFIQWCIKLAEDELKTTQWGSAPGPEGSVRFGSPTDRYFDIAPVGPRSWEITDTVGIDTQQVATILTRASQRVAAQDTGEDLVFQTTLASESPKMSPPVFMLHMPRILGDQRRIQGSRRLSDRALLDFEETPPSDGGPLLFAPTVNIKITTFIPGPADGELARRTAFAIFETVSAICAFALGRVVEPPWAAGFSLSPTEAAVEQSRRRDMTIPGLVRDSVSLDIFGELSALGGPDALLRARNAFITLHEAQRHRNVDIATMLYVSAIEALITPRVQQEWRKDQVTRRFRDGVLSLCTNAVDALLAHGSVEKAFSFKKHGKIKWQRRQVIDRIYELRSLPTHTGIGPSAGDGVMIMGIDHSMRLALLSDLTRAALLAYLQAPRSFLTGHPALQPISTSAEKTG